MRMEFLIIDGLWCEWFEDPGISKWNNTLPHSMTFTKFASCSFVYIFCNLFFAIIIIKHQIAYVHSPYDYCFSLIHSHTTFRILQLIHMLIWSFFSVCCYKHWRNTMNVSPFFIQKVNLIWLMAVVMHIPQIFYSLI